MSETNAVADKANRIPTDHVAAEESTTIALRAHAAHADMSSVWTRLLGTLIYPRAEVAHSDHKRFISYRTILEADDAHGVLQILWKESPYVSAEVLRAANLERTFPRSDITQHGLAVALANTPQEVSAIVTRVRNIAVAGAAYGLVNRTILNQTRVVISGTRLLHEFMLELGQAQYEIAKHLVTPSEHERS